MTRRYVPPQPAEEIEREARGDAAENDSEPAPVDVDKVKELGAVNAEAVQSNRRREEVRKTKRDNKEGKSVAWGEHDACRIYDEVVLVWHPSSISIQVTRLSGNQASWYLYGEPRNGAELYQAIKLQCHGRAAECEYKVNFKDRQRPFDRGIGRVTMPSTLDEQLPPAAQPNAPVGGNAFNFLPHQPGGSPPLPPQQQQPYGVGGGVPPYAQQPPMQPQPQYPQAPASAPGADFNSLMAFQKQQFEMWQAAQAAAHAQHPAPQPQQQQQQPMLAMQPPPGLDFNGIMAWQRQQFDMWQQAMGASRGPVAAGPAQYAPTMQRPMPPPPRGGYAPAPPAVAPPPGYVIIINRDGQQIMVPAEQMGLAGVAGAAAPAGQPPPKPQTPSEQFASALGLMTEAVRTAQAMQSLIPSVGGAAAAAAAPAAAEPEEEDPTKVVKVGDWNLIQTKKDGNLRIVDTLFANGDKIFNFIERERERMQQGMQQQPQQPQPNGLTMPSIPGQNQ